MERTVRQVDSVEEIWETTGYGWVYVQVTGLDGNPRTVGAGGKPGQKLRISEYDRMRNEEVVQDPTSNVFTNGMLVRTSPPAEPNVNQLDEASLLELFELSGDDFASTMDGLNEYNVRRMLNLSTQADATASQIEALRGIINTKWPIGGDTPMYRELQGLGEVASPTR